MSETMFRIPRKEYLFILSSSETTFQLFALNYYIFLAKETNFLGKNQSWHSYFINFHGKLDQIISSHIKVPSFGLLRKCVGHSGISFK